MRPALALFRSMETRQKIREKTNFFARFQFASLRAQGKDRSIPNHN